MQVKCIANTGKGLAEKTIKLGYSVDKNYSELSIDENYVVYGICLETDSLMYLLIGKHASSPFWYPAELFIVQSSLLPLVWFYNFYNYDNYVTAIWGYKELVLDENHNIDLLEKKPAALEIFFRRKEKMDEYEELRVSK